MGSILFMVICLTFWLSGGLSLSRLMLSVSARDELPIRSSSGLRLDCHLPVNPINPNVVILCSLSAQTRPPETTRSKLEVPLSSFARRASSRSRATFCWGVSLAGAGCCEMSMVVLDPRKGICECAKGTVAVKRVASVTDRAIAELCVGGGRGGRRVRSKGRRWPVFPRRRA